MCILTMSPAPQLEMSNTLGFRYDANNVYHELFMFLFNTLQMLQKGRIALNLS